MIILNYSGSVTVVLTSGTVGSKIYYVIGTGPDAETPDNDSAWVDEGDSVTITTLGMNTLL